MEDKALIHVELERKGNRDNVAVRFNGGMLELLMCLASAFIDLEAEYINTYGNRNKFGKDFFGMYALLKSEKTEFDKTETRTHMDEKAIRNIRKILKDGENND